MNHDNDPLQPKDGIEGSSSSSDSNPSTVSDDGIYTSDGEGGGVRVQPLLRPSPDRRSSGGETIRLQDPVLDMTDDSSPGGVKVSSLQSSTSRAERRFSGDEFIRLPGPYANLIQRRSPDFQVLPSTKLGSGRKPRSRAMRSQLGNETQIEDDNKHLYMQSLVEPISAGSSPTRAASEFDAPFISPHQSSRSLRQPEPLLQNIRTASVYITPPPFTYPAPQSTPYHLRKPNLGPIPPSFDGKKLAKLAYFHYYFALEAKIKELIWYSTTRIHNPNLCFPSTFE